MELIKSDIKADAYDSLLLTSAGLEKLYIKRSEIQDSTIKFQEKIIQNKNIIIGEKDGQIVYLFKEIDALKKQNRKTKRKLFFSNFAVVTGVAIGVTTYAVIKLKK